MKFLEHLLNFILNVYLEFIHEASKKSQPSELELILLIFGGPFHRMEPLNFCSNFLMRSASFYHLKTVNTTIFRVKKSVLYSKYMIHSYVSNIFLNKKKMDQAANHAVLWKPVVQKISILSQNNGSRILLKMVTKNL